MLNNRKAVIYIITALFLFTATAQTTEADNYIIDNNNKFQLFVDATQSSDYSISNDKLILDSDNGNILSNRVLTPNTQRITLTIVQDQGSAVYNIHDYSNDAVIGTENITGEKTGTITLTDYNSTAYYLTTESTGSSNQDTEISRLTFTTESISQAEGVAWYKDLGSSLAFIIVIIFILYIFIFD